MILIKQKGTSRMLQNAISEVPSLFLTTSLRLLYTCHVDSFRRKIYNKEKSRMQMRGLLC